VQAAALATLTTLDMIGPTLLVWLAALFGVLNAVDTPLRQSLLSRLVDDPAALPNALALNASLFTASRLIGPPLAGLLLALVGEAVCFALNALFYLALVVPLAWMRLLQVRRRPARSASCSPTACAMYDRRRWCGN